MQNSLFDFIQSQQINTLPVDDLMEIGTDYSIDSLTYEIYNLLGIEDEHTAT